MDGRTFVEVLVLQRCEKGCVGNSVLIIVVFNSCRCCKLSCWLEFLEIMPVHVGGVNEGDYQSLCCLICFLE